MSGRAVEGAVAVVVGLMWTTVVGLMWTTVVVAVFAWITILPTLGLLWSLGVLK